MTKKDGFCRCRLFLFVLALMVVPASLHASKTTVTINGSEQRAVSGNWDVGSLSLTVNGHTETIAFGQFSTGPSVASGLAAKFSLDCNSPVLAHAVGAVITFTTKQLDVSFEQVSASAVWDTGDFVQPSFGIPQPQGAGGKLTTSLDLSCTPNPVPVGGSADCTAKVIKGATGTVNFALGTQSVWSMANVDGDGWAPASTLLGLQAGGPYMITATYSGDSNYSSTTSNYAITVDSGALASATVYSYNIVQADGVTSGYSANSNLLAYNDSVNGQWGWQSPMKYDSLNRLVGGNSSLPGSSAPQYWCWAYDSFGNRIVEATSLLMFSDGSCPMSTTQTVEASSHSFSDGTNQITGDPLIQYDASGNTMMDHGDSYLYDGDGLLCAVSKGSIMTQYIYDADGNRVAKGNITSWSCDITANGFQPTASYVLGQGGEQVTEMSINSGQSTWAHTNVYAGGTLLATYDPLGLHFQLTDWLGSRRAQTNAFGQIEETCLNSPYGNDLVCSSPNGAPSTTDDATEHHFTGKERDAESGLDYFGARYYGSAMGRWTSPDWALKPEAVPYSSLGDPQSLNLYGYVGNNPLGRADADGHCYTLQGCITQWITNGVIRDGGFKPFVKNVGIGLAKGAGQFGTVVVAGLAIQAGVPMGRVITSKHVMKAMDATTPSNLTQAQTAPVGSALAGVALGAGIGSGIGALEGGAEAATTTNLFRAVDATELESIQGTGQFLPSPNGTEYKGFFFEQSSAEQFSAQQSAMGGPSTTVVQGSAPTDLVTASPAHSAATEGSGVLIHNDNLPQVTPHQ